MTKSALQIARAAYQPKLPKALASGAVKAVAGAATQSVADQEAIKLIPEHVWNAVDYIRSW